MTTSLVAFTDQTGHYSYVACLPSGYDKSLKWPVLFLFDPGGDGGGAVEKFKYAAEELGCIVVGSCDSKNGIPWTSTQEIQEAMLRDIRVRYSVDEGRYYAAGFSGGSRVSFFLAYRHPELFRGVIACSSGFPNTSYEIAPGVSAFLISGEGDFRLDEIRDVYKTLQERGVCVEMDLSESGHKWPSEQLIIKALNWMSGK